MKTKITERVVTHTEGVKFGYWNEDTEEFIEVKTIDEIVLAAKELNSSPELIAAIVSLVDIAVDMVGGDLVDIWRRLDSIEAPL